MAQTRKIPRRILMLAALALIGAAMAYAFRPQPALVDLGTVARGLLRETIDEEGRTRVRESYVVSTPVAGRLQRVVMHAGELVKGGETVVAEIRTINPAAQDVRTREQARAAVDAAEAALGAARGSLNAATAADDLAQSALDRTRLLAASGIESQAALQTAATQARQARANLASAEAAIALREAELNNARAMLIGFDDPGLGGAAGLGAEAIELKAPIDGMILQILQESETTLPAGAPIMEIGDIANDLEVRIDLISSDAVQVRPGDRVLFENWGGAETLTGEITRIDPSGVTKISALGVEEQRVGVIASLTTPAAERAGLGHGYRVSARIITWQGDDVLTVPASAVFRSGEGWAVFRVEEGLACERPVKIGHSDGLRTEVTAGLAAGDTVVLYPSSALADGAAVTERQVK
jgi:HlyD family secretion protein